MCGTIHKIRYFGQIISIVMLLSYCCDCFSNEIAAEQPAIQTPSVQNTQKQPNDANETDTKKIDVLKNELQLLSLKIENLRITIDRLAQIYGTLDFSVQQNLMFERLRLLQVICTQAQTERIELEAGLDVLKSKQYKTSYQKRQIVLMELQLETAVKYEQQMCYVFQQEEAKAKRLARGQLAINEYRERLDKSNKIYNNIIQAIEKLESPIPECKT
jgi:hypothetical protein